MSIANRQNPSGHKDLILEIVAIGLICSISVFLIPIPSIYEIVLLFFFGFIAFGLLEYFIHRFIFHLSVKKEPFKTWVFGIHGVHHANPDDQRFYKTSILLKIALVLGINGLGYIIAEAQGLIFSAGFASAYAFYLFIHYCVHHYKAPTNPLKFYWIYHEIHHYINPKNAYGVSNPFWDLVFQTYPRKEEFIRADNKLKSRLE